MWLPLVAAGVAHALQQDLTDEQLDALSELIVTGEVTTLEARWADGPVGGIETLVHVAVDGVVRGPRVDGVDLVLEGGVIGLHRTVHSESPTLHEDVRYALRLVRDDRGLWRVIGGQRGARPLSPEPLAYQLVGWDWAWQDRPVEDGFVLNVGSFPMPPAEVGAAWSLALDLWNVDAVAALYLPNDGTTGSLSYGGGDDDRNVSMYHDFDFGSALAASVYNAVGDDMVDCDTRFYGRNLNGTIDWSLDPDGAAPGRYDLTHTVIHELGHCLGLSHSDDPDALMYAYNGDGTGWERRHLQPDDLAGVHAMYAPATVDLRLELRLADGDGDGVAAIGESFTVTAVAENPTDAPSVDVTLALAVDAAGIELDVDGAALGDLPPGTPAPDTVFTGTVGPGCAATSATLTLTATDLGGHRWTTTAPMPLACGADPGADPDADPSADDPTGAGGCGCAAAPGPSPGWLAGLALLWRRRRARVA